ncbi:MAG TPA: hypothetical protein VIY49_22000 [Bryobacteraceae bacterium]
MSAHSIPHFTVEEYLEMDEAGECRLEYHDGQLFPLADASYAHSALGGGNAYFVLRNALFTGPGSDQAFNE